MTNCPNKEKCRVTGKFYHDFKNYYPSLLNSSKTLKKHFQTHFPRLEIYINTKESY